MQNFYLNYLNSITENGRRRILHTKTSSDIFLDFTSNDYLNLSKNTEVINASIEACKKYGVGSTGSRLLSGNLKIFEELENEIAKSKRSESALIFNTGFQANFSCLQALLNHKVLQERPLVFFDKFNHASLYQGVLSANTQIIRYKHNDINHLSSLLKDYTNSSRPKFIVTETLFGMDGDILPIKEICFLAEKYNALLYLDEAHASGIFGKNGYGLSTLVTQKYNFPLVVMGTFSKALGCSGAYIACSKIIKDYLINTASGFIYSTANSPANVGAMLKSWQLVEFMEEQRNALFAHGKILKNKLDDLDFNTGLSNSHIIPIIFDDEKKALDCKNYLYSKGILTSYVRYPTVPLKTPRIRIAINTNHTIQDINYLLEELKVFKSLSQIPQLSLRTK
jgi:8-amino-7-oxononanoate synthase